MTTGQAVAVTDEDLVDLRRWLAATEPQYLADLAALVNVDCGSYSKAGVDSVGRWASERLADLGAAVTVVPHAELGNTVVATINGGGGPNALLIGHLDTVFADGTAAVRPFAVRARRAYGPGVADMKSGLLTGLYALRALRALGAGARGDTAWLPFNRLVFIANPDEEIGSPVSGSIIRREAARANVALVLECARANGDIVSARKGVVHLVLHISGRAAHAGIEPEKGRSAVLEAAHKTLEISALDGRWPGVTVNVGVVRGGSRPNVVAESAELEIDLRAAERAAMEEAEADLAVICGRTTVPDVACTLALRSRHWPMEWTRAGAELVERAVDLAARLGFELRDAATGGASDANTTAGMGVPTLDGLGPVGGGDHSPDEYVELRSIVPRTTLLAALLLNLGRAPIGRSAGARGDAGARATPLSAPGSPRSRGPAG
jgi:glutamate carboxypeptidase